MRRGLSAGTRAWKSEMLKAWEFESHELRLLQLACECWDRANDAQNAIDREGLTYVDRFGSPHPRPEVKILENAVSQFASIVKQLNLVVEGERRPPGRPPDVRPLKFTNSRRKG